MALSCASGSMPRASTTTADSPVYFFGNSKLAATATPSTDSTIHMHIDLCIQRIRISCDRRIDDSRPFQKILALINSTSLGCSTSSFWIEYLRSLPDASTRLTTAPRWVPRGMRPPPMEMA